MHDDEEIILSDGLLFFINCLDQQQTLPKFRTAKYILDKYNINAEQSLHYAHRIQRRYVLKK